MRIWPDDVVKDEPYFRLTRGMSGNILLVETNDMGERKGVILKITSEGIGLIDDYTGSLPSKNGRVKII